jgi:hypothetical protein
MSHFQLTAKSVLIQYGIYQKSQVAEVPVNMQAAAALKRTQMAGLKM